MAYVDKCAKNEYSKPVIIKYCIYLLSLFLIMGSNVRAQNISEGVAVSLIIENNEIKDGSILCSNPEGIKMCDQQYDANMYGVYVANPAVVLENKSMVEGQPVVNSGKAYVRVMSTNGVIKIGNFIT